MKLKDALPHEFFGYDYPRVQKLLDSEVVKKHNSGDLIHAPETPFKEKYVYTWWELENGYAVGWNENPSRGWSFPVVKLKGV